MSAPSGLGLFQFAAAGTVVVVNGDVYYQQGDASVLQPRRLARLDVFARARVGPATRARDPDSVMGVALTLASRVDELRFVLSELVPYLTFLRDDDERRLAPPPELAPCLATVQGLARALKSATDAEPGASDASDRLARLLGTPCAIIGRCIVPLEPVAAVAPACAGPRVAIGDTIYRLCAERSRDADNVIAWLQAAHNETASRSTPSAQAECLATALLAAVRRTLCGRPDADPRDPDLAYMDARHQVLHRRGRIELIRSALVRRSPPVPVFVGLEIAGSTRARRLAVAPRHAVSLDALLGRNGAGATLLCMGSRPQYQHLLSSDFTDAEALVQYLDAATKMICPTPHRRVPAPRLSVGPVLPGTRARRRRFNHGP